MHQIHSSDHYPIVKGGKAISAILRMLMRASHTSGSSIRCPPDSLPPKLGWPAAVVTAAGPYKGGTKGGAGSDAVK